ncbi:SGNH/GDSL hydrolase family protein [Lactobacillus sp.]|uniref:SGNH/GDSL hydrolase family protein n=1 Tax=Lactobacillus sp. TaxID=1591 RepID=UPI001995565C|nr:SGNH/GDSL hydrolase family protein [Lactobacillus sp.]MBD5429351.1 SGNH/GDSL hydrolase family protein [Lactobacillus sp.]
MVEKNTQKSLNSIPSINNDARPYIIPLDIYKEGSWAYDISNYYKGRVNDNGTPFEVRWYEHGRLKNVQGLRPFMRGQVGKYSIEEDEHGNKRVVMANDATQIEIVGETSDCREGGIAIYRMVDQAFPQDGIFYGYIGLRGTDDKGSVRETGVDIIFKVLGSHMNMLGAREYYVSELEQALIKFDVKLDEHNKDFQEKIFQQEQTFKRETEQLIQETRDTYNQRVEASEDSMNALDREIKANRAEQGNLTTQLSGIQHQILLNDIITVKQYEENWKTTNQAINEKLTGMSKSGPFFFENETIMKSMYPDGHEGILVTQNNLHWHYWDTEKEEYVDGGKYIDSTSLSLKDIQARNRAFSNTNSLFDGRSETFLKTDFTDFNASGEMLLYSKYGIEGNFKAPGVLKKVKLEPYKKGKVYFAIGTQLDANTVYIKDQVTAEVTHEGYQSFDVNLHYEAGDIFYFSGPVLRSERPDDGFEVYERRYDTEEEAATSSFLGYQTVNKIENRKFKINLAFIVDEQLPNTTNFPSKYHGKRSDLEIKDFYREKNVRPVSETDKVMLDYHFKDAGEVATIHYNAIKAGKISLSVGDITEVSPLANGSSRVSVRVHDSISFNVAKAGSGTEQVKLPFFAGDVLIFSGPLCFSDDDSGFSFATVGYKNFEDVSEPIHGKNNFFVQPDRKIKVNFWLEIDANNEVINEEKILYPVMGKKYACFGDSIWSDQVTGIGTLVAKDLKADMIGNFAVGNACASDWHDTNGNNLTKVSFTEPANTDTSDNTLSNQIRRILQYTTPKGEKIKWTHPYDGEFSLDAEGTGHSDDKPDVISIAISTNDGKHEETKVVDDTDFVLSQDYKNLTRTSLASALRWAIETLRCAYPQSQVFVSTPLQAAKHDSDFRSYEQNLVKTDIIKKVCQYCSVQVIDQFSKSGFSRMVALNGTTSSDGTHPNDSWSRFIAEFNANYINHNYISG